MNFMDTIYDLVPNFFSISTGCYKRSINPKKKSRSCSKCKPKIDGVAIVYFNFKQLSGKTLEMKAIASLEICCRLVIKNCGPRPNRRLWDYKMVVRI